MSTSKNLSWADRLRSNQKTVPQTSPPKNNNDNGKVDGDGRNIKLVYNYVLWANNPLANDWRAKDTKVTIIKTAADFWKLMNNFNKMGPKFMRYYLMREGVDPRFEDTANRAGGILSIKLDTKKGLKVWEEIAVQMVLSNLLKPEIKDTINGIAINPKKDYLFVKIWNMDGEQTLIKTLRPEILSDLADHSVLYKKIEPDY